MPFTNSFVFSLTICSKFQLTITSSSFTTDTAIMYCILFIFLWNNPVFNIEGGKIFNFLINFNGVKLYSSINDKRDFCFCSDALDISSRTVEEMNAVYVPDLI